MFSAATPPGDDGMSKRILFVLSSHDELGNSGNKSGSWLEELAAPYWRFRDAGYDVVLASPRPQRAPIDPLSVQDAWLTDAGRRFLADSDAQAALASTISIDQVDAATLDGVFLVGGAATTWDFPNNEAIKRIVQELHAESKIIAAICHGVIGLTRVMDEFGQSLLKNRMLTSISNAEDAMMGIDKIVPVLPEEMLRKSRAIYTAAAPLTEHVVCDPPFFTGQNPASADLLARKIVAHLERAG
jgi:putative intracellular protease/amidase